MAKNILNHKNIDFYLTLLLLITSCSNIKNSANVSNSQDLSEYVKYQTFDEYAMCGCDSAVHEPFVSVLAEDSLMHVIISSNLDSVITYLKRDGYWISEKYENYDCNAIDKNGDNLPRRYKRFFINGTILDFEFTEIVNNNIKNIIDTKLYIKTRNNIIIVSPSPVSEISDLNKFHSTDLLNLINTYNSESNPEEVDFNGKSKYALKLSKLTEADSVVYYANLPKGIVKKSIQANALGEYGMPIGLNLLDINYQKAENNDNTLFVEARYPNGTAAMNRFIESKIRSNKDRNYIGNYTVILKVNISRTGKIKTISLARKPCPKELFDESVQIVKGMPDFIPAKKNGRPVGSTIYIPIRFDCNT